MARLLPRAGGCPPGAAPPSPLLSEADFSLQEIGFAAVVLPLFRQSGRDFLSVGLHGPQVAISIRPVISRPPPLKGGPVEATPALRRSAGGLLSLAWAP